MDRLGETLMATSMIRLFGRKWEGFTINVDAIKSLINGSQPALSIRNPLMDKLHNPNPNAKNPTEDLEPNFARIFGFSYDGAYFKLERPSIYLVHGEGATLDMETVSKTGVELFDRKLGTDIRMWAYDQIDYSMRIDLHTGWLEHILLDFAVGNATDVTAGNLVAGEVDTDDSLGPVRYGSKVQIRQGSKVQVRHGSKVQSRMR